MSNIVNYVERYNHKEEEWERLGVIRHILQSVHGDYVFYRTGWSGFETYDMGRDSLAELQSDIREAYPNGWGIYEKTHFGEEK